MATARHAFLLGSLSLLFLAGVACEAAPLMGLRQSSLGFFHPGLAGLYRGF
jgi:hypothetical protein